MDPTGSGGPFHRDLASPHPGQTPHQTLHALHHGARDPRESTGAADADVSCVAKSQAVPQTHAYARTQQVKRSQQQAGGAGSGGSSGDGPVLPLAGGGLHGHPPPPPHGPGSRVPSRVGAPSRNAGGLGLSGGRALALAGRLAPWLAVAALGITLLILAAPAADLTSSAPARATPYDVKLELGPYFFNPSIVKHRGVFLSTARTAHMKRIEKTNWWFNDAYICMSTSSDFDAVSCRKFDPWQG